MNLYTVSADAWQHRMPTQCFFVGVGTGGMPMAANGHVKLSHLGPLLIAIEQGKLDGTLYRDGEVWVDAELLAYWLEAREVHHL